MIPSRIRNMDDRKKIIKELHEVEKGKSFQTMKKRDLSLSCSSSENPR